MSQQNFMDNEELHSRSCSCHAIFCCAPSRFDGIMLIGLGMLLGPLIYLFVVASPDIDEHSCVTKSWTLVGTGILLVTLVLISCWRSCVGFYHERKEDKKKVKGTCHCGHVNYACTEGQDIV